LQEIRGQGYQAAFSQRSDIYAFGCILYRLCSLEEPGLLDNFNPSEMSMNYSVELLKLISTMLSSERDERPTAVQVKDRLKTIALQLFQPKTTKCHTCEETFPSRNQLTKHLKQTGHYRSAAGTDAAVLPAPNASGKTSGFNICGYAEIPGQPGKENELRIRGCADAPVQYHYDEKNLDAVDPSPCAVCKRHFKTKKQFFTHLLGGPRHFRGAKYVQKRKAERGLDSDVEKEDERLAKWARKDMERHN
jgi:serine/threonine protein kinase